jgi:hypothetical protein
MIADIRAYLSVEEGGQIISNIGNEISAIAFPLLVLLVTGSPAQAGFVSAFCNTVYISFRLTLTPDELRGRVNSVARLIANGLSSLGLALTGISLQYLGPQITVLISGCLQVLLALVAMTNFSIRKA